MHVRVVCISRAMGAGGETIGQLVAQHLGFRYVDEQIITLAARQAQIDPALVAAAEQRQSLLKRLLDKLPSGLDVAGAITVATGVPVESFASGASSHRAAPEDMRVLIRAAIHEVASAGTAVIVAHAASIALAEVPGVLRVLVTAPGNVRAKRLSTTEGLPPEAADAAIGASDLERRDYLKRFYGVKEELPTHYDIVINTDVLTAEQAAAVVAAATSVGRGDGPSISDAEHTVSMRPISRRS
jgi:cytidylate kinase